MAASSNDTITPDQLVLDPTFSERTLPKLLTQFEWLACFTMLLSIAFGGMQLPVEMLPTQLFWVGALFAARFALAYAQTNFQGAGRALTIICEYGPTFFLPRFGSIDPIAIPLLLTGLRLATATGKPTLSLSLGLCVIILRQALLVSSWTDFLNIATFLFSSFVVAVPLIVVLRVTTSTQVIEAKLAAQQLDTAGEKKLTTIDTTTAAQKVPADQTAASEPSKPPTDLTDRTTIEAPAGSNKAVEPEPAKADESNQDPAPPKEPTPPPLPTVPPKLAAIDWRATICFISFYIFHVFAVARDPKHNAIVQAVLLLIIATLTHFAVRGGKLKIAGRRNLLVAKIGLITLFSAGAFDLVNGDVLLYLTVPEVFLLLGATAGIQPLLIAIGCAFVPRGTDQIIESALRGQFQLSNLGWLYDWNGHTTTAAILALLGACCYSLQRYRESPVVAALAESMLNKVQQSRQTKSKNKQKQLSPAAAGIEKNVDSNDDFSDNYFIDSFLRPASHSSTEQLLSFPGSLHHMGDYGAFDGDSDSHSGSDSDSGSDSSSSCSSGSSCSSDSGSDCGSSCGSDD